MAKKSQLLPGGISVLLYLFPVIASAAVSFNGGDTLDEVIQKFQSAGQQWMAILGPASEHIFLSLAVIGLIWNCGFLIIDRADIGSFFSTVIRWMLFTGFFWWLVKNGSIMAESIIASFATLGSKAAGTGPSLGPSTPLSIAMQILAKAGDAGHWYQLGDQICLVIVMMIILVAMAIISANMLITACTAWLLIYAGQILLGFGAVKWTSDIAINYLRQVLSTGVTYMAMLLLVGVADEVMSDYVKAMNENTLTWQADAVVAVVAVVLAFLIHKVPPLVGAITGGSTGAAGTLGVGTAIGAMTTAGSAVATGGAALLAAGASVVANAAGGAKAIMAAASAAGDSTSGGESSLGGAAPPKDSGRQTESSLGTPTTPSPMGVGPPGSGGGGTRLSDQPSPQKSADKVASPINEHQAVATAETQDEPSDHTQPTDQNNKQRTDKGSRHSGSSRIARAATFAAATTGHLAKGTGGVMAARVAAWKERANARIDSSMGGQIAQQIRATAATQSQAGSGSSSTPTSTAAPDKPTDTPHGPDFSDDTIAGDQA